jgi:RNA polymerase sigma-70 factor (ECF subfamily)
MARRDLAPFDLPDLAGAAAAPSLELEAVFRDGLGRLRQVALRITRDAAAADDVLQGALEKALRYRARFRGDAKASTWRRRAVKEGQRAALHAALAPPARQPLDALLARERDEGVRRALRTLRPDDADLLVHCAEERGYESWARSKGLARTAAKTRAFRARRALRAALEAADA